MVTAGYFLALLIGLSLGMIGGGGSIFTVPVLVYLLGIPPVLATSYSLFIVGSTSLVGAASFLQKRQMDIRVSLVFGVPSVAGVFLVRTWILPGIPPHLFMVGDIDVTRDLMIMILLGLTMLATAAAMFYDARRLEPVPSTELIKVPLVAFLGLVVGLFTGFLGIGGGFLTIPVLVMFARIRMKVAIGSSLAIIAAKSLVGFAGDIRLYKMDWNLLFSFTAIAVAGILLGSFLTKFVPGRKLKPAFGWMVLLMGVVIFIQELIL